MKTITLLLGLCTFTTYCPTLIEEQTEADRRAAILRKQTPLDLMLKQSHGKLHTDPMWHIQNFLNQQMMSAALANEAELVQECLGRKANPDFVYDLQKTEQIVQVCRKARTELMHVDDPVSADIILASTITSIVAIEVAVCHNNRKMFQALRDAGSQHDVSDMVHRCKKFPAWKQFNVKFFLTYNPGRSTE